MYKDTSIILPWTTGVKTILSDVGTEYKASTVTSMLGYLNNWYPVPLDLKETYFLLIKSVLSVPPTPAFDNLKVSSSILITLYWFVVVSPDIDCGVVDPNPTLAW